MKEYTSHNKQLKILRKRKLRIPNGGKAIRFLEQENYYNVINGYKDLFLKRDLKHQVIVPEEYIRGANFDELKSLFLFDREIRFLFLEYILILENSFKSVISHEFCNKYSDVNSYLEISSYRIDNPKMVLKLISNLVKTIHDKVDQEGAIKHYIEEHGSVPLWVLVNYLTLGNISYFYSVLKDSEQNIVAKFYSDKFNKQYKGSNLLHISSQDIASILKVFNLIRNKCAHDERLYNSNFKNVRISNFTRYFSLVNIESQKLISAIIYLKVLLNKKEYKSFKSRLFNILQKYRNDYKC